MRRNKTKEFSLKDIKPKFDVISSYTFDLWGSNLGFVITGGSFLAIPNLILYFAKTKGYFPINYQSVNLKNFLFIFAIYFLLSLIAGTFFKVGLYNSAINKQKPSLKHLKGFGLYLIRNLIFQVLVILLLALFIALSYIVIFFTASLLSQYKVASIIAVILIYAFILVFIIILFLKWYISNYIFIFEKQSFFKSLKISAERTKGYRSMILGLLVSFYFFAFFPYLLFKIPLNYVINFTSFDINLLDTLFNIFLSLFWYPILNYFPFLIYYSLTKTKREET